MSAFQFQNAELDGLVQISPFHAPDNRGYLSKPFEFEVFAAHGIQLAVAEELESKSCRDTLRGLHFQREHSQDKLVRVLYGEVFDVAVDLRPQSSTFGKWQGFYLSADNRQMLYIPKQFAHGFLVLSSEAVLHYLCGDCYDPDSETGIIWNDPQIGIEWPLERVERIILSEKDAKLPFLADFEGVL